MGVFAGCFACGAIFFTFNLHKFNIKLYLWGVCVPQWGN